MNGVYEVIGSLSLNTVNDDKERRAYVQSYIFSFFDLDTDGHSEIVEIEDYEEACEFLGTFSDTQNVPVLACLDAWASFIPLRERLESIYNIEVFAQNTNKAYYIDLKKDDKTALRLWDVSFLEPRGIEAIAEVSNVEDIDSYTFAKTAGKYLRYIVDSNPFINNEDLGYSVLTKTSIVRKYMERVIGIERSGANGETASSMFLSQCNRESARNYEQYATRKSCFRGGLAFASAKNAGHTFRDVISLDVCSMHHLHMSGHYYPTSFRKTENSELINIELENIKNKTASEVLADWHMPFTFFMNACIKFTNIKVKSIFESQGIATLSLDKFYISAARSSCNSISKAESIARIYECGYHDDALNPRIAYGKIMQADELYAYVTELEFWVMCQVYDFDSFEFISGETTRKSELPPDLITLASCNLFDEKQKEKRYISSLKESGSIDEARKAEAKYQIITKGKFNSIYGTQCQDVNNIKYIYNNSRIETSNTFTLNKSGKVWYNYGIRIAGWSRVHMIATIILLYKEFGESIQILGGDTDSLKMSIGELPVDSIMNVIKKINDAASDAINICTRRIMDNYSIYREMEGCGHWVYEGKSDMMRQYWTKCRLSISCGKSDLVCAGLPKPVNDINMNDIIDAMIMEGVEYDEIFDLVCGFDVELFPGVSHVFECIEPDNGDCLIIDGKKKMQCGYIYEVGYRLGDLANESNIYSILYKNEIGDEINMSGGCIELVDGNIYIYGRYFETCYTDWR